MERAHDFVPGCVVSHFKRAALSPSQLAQEPRMYLYRIIGQARHTESDELLMVYEPLYGGGGLYARPLAMFLSPVDRAKYPDAVQTYRFERFEEDLP